MKGLDVNKDKQISEQDFYHPKRPSIGMLRGIAFAIRFLPLSLSLATNVKRYIRALTRVAVPLLTPAGVADWVKYAVQLPEYAKAFEDSNVNWLDFSVLMQVRPSSFSIKEFGSTKPILTNNNFPPYPARHRMMARR